MTARIATPEDNALLTSICMHPEVRRWTAFDGAPDFDPSAYTDHPKSFAVIVNDGCFTCPALEQGAYAVHTNLLPSCRGAAALREAQHFLNFVFLHTDAEQLVSMVPANNPQTLWFARAMKFRETYRRPDVWLSGGVKHAMQYLRFDIDDWVLATRDLQALGHDFHEGLGEHQTHAEDPVHDAYVGAAWALIQAGQVDKAQRLYGRWARAAGYQPFEIVSRDPLRIDIGTCVLHMHGEEFTVEEK